MKKKKLILLLCVHLLIVHPQLGFAQDLEESIEDELGDGGSDTAVDEPISEELDEGEGSGLGGVEEEEEAEKAEKSAKKSQPKAKAKQSAKASPKAKTEDDADEEDDDAEMQAFEDEGEEDSGDANAESTEETESEPTEESEGTADAEEPTETPDEEPKKPAKNIYAETLSGFDDNVNSAFEDRIYRMFSGRTRLDEGAWSAMVAQQSTGLYRVQKGDTLWDISRTFFGDGHFWPKLWSENSVLTNPHEIIPGKGVAFVAGTEENAPMINVTNLRMAKGMKADPINPEAEFPPPVYPEDPEAQLSSDDVAAGSVLEEQTIVGGRPDIPEPLTPSKRILKRLPPSFVEPVPPRVAREFDRSGLDVGRRKAVDVPAKVYMTSYLSDGKPDSFGKVDEIVLQEKTAGYLQDIILKLDREASPGERFTVVMLRPSVSHPKSRTYGPVVEIGGTVEVKEVVDEDRRAYRATIIRSVNAIEKGALVTDLELPVISFSRNSTRSKVEARIIGGEFNDERKLLGPGSVIYLDKGSAEGLEEGQILAVQSRHGERKEDTNYPEMAEPLAVIKIGRVLERVATAVILESYGEVRPGDMTGGPFPRPKRSLVLSRKTMSKNIEANLETNDEEFTEETEGGDGELEMD